MGWLRDFFLKKLLLDWVVAGLNKLPANGKKTIIGVLVLVLGQVTEYLATTPGIGVAESLLELLQNIPHETLSATGLGAIVVGATHKVLKWINKLLGKDEVIKSP